MKLAGKVREPWALDMVTVLSSIKQIQFEAQLVCGPYVVFPIEAESQDVPPVAIFDEIVIVAAAPDERTARGRRQTVPLGQERDQRLRLYPGVHRGSLRNEHVRGQRFCLRIFSEHIQ